MTLQDVYTLIRTATTSDELDAAESEAVRYALEHPADEHLVAAGCEMLCMKRESIALYGVSERA